MVFNKLGGIYYNETYEIQKMDYGGSIPCFIGRTINPDKTFTTEQINDQKYYNKAKADLTTPTNTPTEAEIQAKILELKQAENITFSETDTTNAIKTLKEAEESKHRIGELQKFTNFTQVNRTSLTDGKLDGLGDYETEKNDNPLLKVIHDFCEETKLMTEEYVACPYFYVIDLGEADNIIDWINSIETSKTKREIDLEIYVGFDRVKDTVTVNNTTTEVDASYESFILAVNYDLMVNRQAIGDFRKAFFTIPFKIDETTKAYVDNNYYKDNYKTIDNELITLTNALITNNDSQFHLNETTNSYDGITLETTNTISKSRTYVCEPLWFGKTIGRITTTPYDMEPGYYKYNTLTVNDIILRKPSEKLKLQMGGIIFNQLEETSTEEYVKINRTQSVSSRLVDHPTDTLYQSRHLVDYLITKVFDACYPQIKNKETETNLSYLQTQVNKIVNDSIANGDFIAPYVVNNERKGTFLSIQESEEDAYDIEIIGMVQPVNCTYSIHIVAQINDAKIKIIENG